MSNDIKVQVPQAQDVAALRRAVEFVVNRAFTEAGKRMEPLANGEPMTTAVLCGNGVLLFDRGVLVGVLGGTQYTFNPRKTDDLTALWFSWKGPTQKLGSDFYTDTTIPGMVAEDTIPAALGFVENGSSYTTYTILAFWPDGVGRVTGIGTSTITYTVLNGSAPADYDYVDLLLCRLA